MAPWKELKRKIDPEESMNTHLLPRLCGGVQLQLETARVSATAMTRMAGNAMNIPCLAAVVMAAVLGLDSKK